MPYPMSAARGRATGAAATGALLTNLISWWALEEAANATHNDSHGTNHLTPTNSPPQVAGLVGNAAEFNQANDRYLYSASNATLQAGDIDFTLCAWVKFTNTTSVFMLSKDNSTAGRREFVMYRNGVDNKAGFAVFRATDSQKAVVSGNAMTIDVWSFVVGWHDAAADKVWVQLDNGTPVSLNTGGALQAASDAQFRIGDSQYTGVFNWIGPIDEVGYWKRVLTADERTWLYNSGSGRTYADLASY